MSDPSMYSKGFEVSDFYPYAKPALIAAGLFGVPYLIEKATNAGIGAISESMKEIVKKDKAGNQKKITTDNLLAIAKKKGGISHLSHYTLPGYQNAAYIPPNTISQEEEKKIRKRYNQMAGSKNPTDQVKARFLKKTLEFSKNPHGGIIIGDKFDNPAVVGHEIGHAIINEQGGINNAIQRHSSTLQRIGAPVALAGIAAKFLKPDISDYLFYGGLGTYGLGTAGKMYNEYSASAHAKDMLAEADGLTPERRKLLDLALTTYGIRSASTAGKQLGMWGIGGLA